MKNIFLLFACALLLLPYMASSQALEYNNSTINFEGKDRPAIVLTIGPETKEVKKAWKKFIQKEHDVDVDGLGLFTNKEVLRVEKAVIKSISDKQIDLFAKIVEEGESTTMSVFGSFGYNLYLSPEEFPKEYAAMENIVFDFLNKLLPDYLAENVEELEEKLSDLKKAKEDKSKTINSNEKEIAKMKKEIEEMQKQNKTLSKELIEDEKVIGQTSTKLRIKKRSLQSIGSTIEAVKSDQ